MKTSWSVDEALEQIESCKFECEGGLLEKNVAYEFLAKALRIGPRYLPGMGVEVRLTAKVSTSAIEWWDSYYIVAVHMASDTERRYWAYDLTKDPPAPYHYGKTQLCGIGEYDMRLLSDGSSEVR